MVRYGSGGRKLKMDRAVPVFDLLALPFTHLLLIHFLQPSRSFYFCSPAF